MPFVNDKEHHHCSRKVPFTTRKAAENCRTLVNKRNDTYQHGKRKLRVYHCSVCGLYHLGNKSSRGRS